MTLLHLLSHMLKRHLPLRLESILLETHCTHTNRYLVFALTQLAPCALDVILQGNSNRASALDIRLVFLIVQLSLYGWWQKLDTLDTRFAVQQLLSQAENPVMQSSFGSAVVGAAEERDESETGCGECNGCCRRFRLCFEIWQECHGHVDVTEIVCCEFCFHHAEIYCVG